MTFHPLQAACDQPDTNCACEVFVNANPTSGGMWFTDGATLIAKTLAALPAGEADAVNATAATRLIKDATGLTTSGARFHLVHTVRNHQVACRLTPGGHYRLWVAA